MKRTTVVYVLSVGRNLIIYFLHHILQIQWSLVSPHPLVDHGKTKSPGHDGSFQKKRTSACLSSASVADIVNNDLILFDSIPRYRDGCTFHYFWFHELKPIADESHKDGKKKNHVYSGTHGNTTIIEINVIVWRNEDNGRGMCPEPKHHMSGLTCVQCLQGQFLVLRGLK